MHKLASNWESRRLLLLRPCAVKKNKIQEWTIFVICFFLVVVFLFKRCLPQEDGEDAVLGGSAIPRQPVSQLRARQVSQLPAPQEQTGLRSSGDICWPRGQRRRTGNNSGYDRDKKSCKRAAQW